jgi:transcription antitermination factor NusG
MAEAQSQKELVRKWYVVRAISGKEKKVKQYIESEINRLKTYRLCRTGFNSN